MPEVRHNATARRFELDIDGHMGKAWYRLSPGTITFTHTDVPDALAGRGVGSKLARAALEYARTEKLRVVPLCPFIAAYIQKHPAEYGDLVASGGVQAQTSR